MRPAARILVLSFLLSASSAHARSEASVTTRPAVFLVTGQNLYGRCTSTKQDDRAMCQGYIAGVADAMTQASSISRDLERYAPRFDLKVTGPEIVAEVVKVMSMADSGHIPGLTLDRPANDFVLLGIRQATKAASDKK